MLVVQVEVEEGRRVQLQQRSSGARKATGLAGRVLRVGSSGRAGLLRVLGRRVVVRPCRPPCGRVRSERCTAIAGMSVGRNEKEERRDEP